ncbi:7tm 6 domain containing protein [Asbolus verrucosus]|uniref:7tm 6 domain containing protein n=1 Tax=Asbolus verrucosus TaxID=1661398 RepID=A0A482W1W2_ASBVE|nr:7tm 6 domain containing protein [Asbolus verrucosus]
MERFDWKGIIKLNLFFLWTIGLWPKADEVYKLNFYTLYSVISMIFFICSFGMLATVNIFVVDSDFEDSEEMIMYLLGGILTQLKVYMFIKHMKMLKQLMTTLNSDIFQPKTLKQKCLVEPALNFWRIIYNAFTTIGGPVITLWLFLPLLSKNKQFQLPINVWYPYNTKTSLFYKITYIHQIFSVFYTVIFVYNADMLIAALMVYVGAQCDILCDDLRSLQDDQADNFFKKLINSIQHHEEILRSVIISLILYRLALNKHLDIKFVAHIILVTFYMLQIFTYCWFGNEVIVKIEGIHDDARPEKPKPDQTVCFQLILSLTGNIRKDPSLSLDLSYAVA